VVERVGVATGVVDGTKGVVEGVMVVVPLLRLEVTVLTPKAAVGVATIVDGGVKDTLEEADAGLPSPPLELVGRAGERVANKELEGAGEAVIEGVKVEAFMPPLPPLIVGVPSIVVVGEKVRMGSRVRVNVPPPSTNPGVPLGKEGVNVGGLKVPVGTRPEGDTFELGEEALK
jgi:hypothetical protein